MTKAVVASELWVASQRLSDLCLFNYVFFVETRVNVSLLLKRLIFHHPNVHTQGPIVGLED